MRQIIILLAAILLCSCSADNETKAQTTMNTIYVTIDGQTQSVTLADIRLHRNSWHDCKTDHSPYR